MKLGVGGVMTVASVRVKFWLAQADGMLMVKFGLTAAIVICFDHDWGPQVAPSRTVSMTV